MIEQLECLAADISALNSKLLLLVGPRGSGKSILIQQLAVRRHALVLSLGSTLGRELLVVPSTRRHLQVVDLLNVLANSFTKDGTLLLDNIELLFDRTLQLSPLDLLKRHAQVRRVIAVWPGEFRQERLTYAASGHPEHQDYGLQGVVLFKTH